VERPMIERGAGAGAGAEERVDAGWMDRRGSGSVCLDWPAYL
jgi:hypothetical protein